jgi:heptaprenyl diphosphate synthase
MAEPQPLEGLAFHDAALTVELQAGLASVEALLRESVKSDDAFVAETARHLVEAGGKRSRPLLVLLAAQFGDPAAPGIVPAGAVVELTHLATLYHDDVMDEATMRRGAQSANSRWTNTVAILTGDFLFSRASDLLADLGPEAVRIQARTFARLVQGQMAETIGPGEGADPVAHYLQVVADKTGALIGTAGRFGAMFGKAPDPYVDALARFAERFGIAFQLSDDLIDVASESGESGKTPGTDLREGVHTLPVLLALRAHDTRTSRLRELLASDLADDAVLTETLDHLRAHPAMSQARTHLVRTVAEAREALIPLPDGPPRDALNALCDFVVERTG